VRSPSVQVNQARKRVRQWKWHILCCNGFQHHHRHEIQVGHRFRRQERSRHLHQGCDRLQGWRQGQGWHVDREGRQRLEQGVWREGFLRRDVRPQGGTQEQQV